MNNKHKRLLVRIARMVFHPSIADDIENRLFPDSVPVRSIVFELEDGHERRA